MMGMQGNAPYLKPLKVMVLERESSVTAYKNAKDEDKSLINTVVGDSTRAVKCVVYDTTKFERFNEGQCLILRNVIKKPEHIAVTANTKIFPAAGVNVPPEIRQAGRFLLHPPAAAVATVKDALGSPPKTKVSVLGKIVQEEAPIQVNTAVEKGVKLKNIYLEDATKKCRVALWRKMSEEPVRAGDFVQITDLVTNTFRNEVSLQSTSRTTITKVEAPVEVKEVNIIGACVEGEVVTFLQDDDEVQMADLKIVTDALPDVENVEQHILGLCNPSASVRVSLKGSDVIKLEFM